MLATQCLPARQVVCRVWPFATPWTAARQAPLSVGLSRQEDWSGLPYPPPGDLPNSGIKPMFLRTLALAGVSLPLVPTGKPLLSVTHL